MIRASRWRVAPRSCLYQHGGETPASWICQPTGVLNRATTCASVGTSYLRCKCVETCIDWCLTLLYTDPLGNTFNSQFTSDPAVAGCKFTRLYGLTGGWLRRSCDMMIHDCSDQPPPRGEPLLVDHRPLHRVRVFRDVHHPGSDTRNSTWCVGVSTEIGFPSLSCFIRALLGREE